MQHRPLQNSAKQTATGTLPGAINILPGDKTQALHHLIKLTKHLVDISDKESQALAQNDMLSFAILQDEKALLAEHYAKASEEFRARLPQFRGISPTLLDRLENLQIQLGDISKSNHAIVKEIYERSRANTQTTLLNAQEMGQDKRLHFANSNDQNGPNDKKTNEVKHA